MRQTFMNIWSETKREEEEKKIKYKLRIELKALCFASERVWYREKES